MSTFTKTKIVDADGGGDYTSIREATKYFIDNNIGGIVYVESGLYEIDGTNNGVDKRRIEIPSNVTLIGHGNVVIKVTAPDQSAFMNYNQETGNDRITITGFKIVVACGTNGPYNTHLIFMQNVSNSVIEKLTIEAPYDQDHPNETNPRGVAWGKYAILFYARDYDVRHDCKNNIIRQCFINNFGNIDPYDQGVKTKYKYGNGIGFSQHNQSEGICSENIVKNNYVALCHTNLYCLYAERNTIKGNIFIKAIGYDSGDPGLAINIGLERCKNMVLIGNQINETDKESTPNKTGSHGLYPSGCKGLIVKGNVFFKNADAGIKIRFTCNAALNQDYSCPQGQEEPDKYHVVMGNVCTENGVDGHGIHLQGFTQWHTIIGNSCCKNAKCGIRLQTEQIGTPPHASKYNMVLGNVCALNEETPISIMDSSNCEADNMTD
jgi:hypothetical protein